jgi:HD-GYP domain-containing protein (c-di-GMP phosphodiesterase class II)
MYAKAAPCWDIYTRAPNARGVDSSVGLIAEARERQSKELSRRERLAAYPSALLFAAGTVALWVAMPPEGAPHPLLIALLVGLYATVSRVEFEVGPVYAVPEQLVFVPMLFLVPLPLVPLLVAVGFVLAEAPEYIGGRVRLNRALWCFNDALFAFGPVLVLAAFGAAEAPELANAGIYLAAFAAQVATGATAATIHEALAHRVPVRQVLQSLVWSYRIDAVLSPVGLMVALQAVDHPLAIAAVVPLVWLLYVFSHERKERHAASLELNQAYRGTVMLLSDVVEADDNYTADHCRSVVELVTDVADEMRIPAAQRQELEFAALLHDVGKIAIPKDILNKPAKLTDEEFELIKTHTIEGQLLLDRVGGLLGRVGEIVRSCHERWDGRGYPDGLAGEAIPLAARIVFCCDAYNAMTTDRPYRNAMSREAAIAELRDNSGTQFDPQVVVAVETVVSEQVQYPYLAHVSASEAVAATLAATRSQPQAAAS